MNRVYTFNKLLDLPEQTAGSGYGKYWNYIVKSHGRDVFTEAVQSHIDDLPADPWDTTNNR